MTDPIVNKMGLSVDLGLLMPNLVMMDTVDLAMMSWIRKLVIRMHGMQAQGIVYFS